MLPLRPDDEEPEVDLQRLVETVYDRGSYDLRLDYRTEPITPLGAAATGWADDLLRARSLR